MESQIIQCRVCHNGIAKNAKVCPHCGAKNKKPFYTHWWIWVILGLFLLDYVCFYASKANDAYPQSAPETTEAATTAATTTATTKATTNATTAALKEAVLYESDRIRITAKKLQEQDSKNAELHLLIENDTQEDLTFQVRDVSVNGCMVDTMFSSSVAAGKKINDKITFLSSDLDLYDIKRIKEIELYFHIFQSSDWNERFDTEIVKLTTNAENVKPFLFVDDGVVAYDENGIKIVPYKFIREGSGAPALMVYIENNTEKCITVQARNESVNGFMVDSMFSAEIASGKCIIDDLRFLKSSFEDNEIEKVETIELYFHVFDSETWKERFDTETVSLVVN